MHRTEQPPAGDRRASRRAAALRLRCRARRRCRSLWLGLLRQLAVRRRCRCGAIVFYVVVYTMLLKRRTAAEHRLGRRRRLHAGAHRLVRGDRTRCPGRRSCCSRHLLLDAAALLAAVDAVQGRLRGGRRADAAGRGRGRRRRRARSSSTAGRSSPPRCCWCRSPAWAGSTSSSRSSPAACSCSRRTGCSRRAKAPETAPRSLKPMRLFHFSITYLTLLFLAVAIDPLLHLPL